MAEVAGVVCVTLGADGPDDTVGAISSARLASQNTRIEPSDPARVKLLAAGEPTAEVRSRLKPSKRESYVRHMVLIAA